MSEMEYGYCRVSTTKKDSEGRFVQTTDLQREALEQAGITSDRIFEDRASGSQKIRPGLDALLDVVQRGDVVVIWKLDRLGRNSRNLLEIAENLEAKGVSIRSIQDGLDTRGTFGKFLLSILGAVAELERENIRERVTAGMATAKRQGVHVGRKQKLSRSACDDVADSHRNGVTVSALAKRYNVARSTIYDVLSRYQGVVGGEQVKLPM